MGARRKARVCALQMLFQYDVARPRVDELTSSYWEAFGDEMGDVAQDFSDQLALGAISHLDEIDALICLGAVIRGETSHNEYIAAEVFKGIAHVSLETSLPIALGVVTADNLEQAIDRAGAKSGNKGFEAAMTAIELANLYREL